MSDIITLDVEGHVAKITLNRPEARNAVSPELAQALESAIDRFEEDDDLWVAVLAANTARQERPVFSAGADLRTVNEGRVAELRTKRGGFAGFVQRQRRKPVVAAVDGLATAGGLEIVLACDVVVATTRSSFGLAEVTRNLIAAAGGLFRLPRVIGPIAAMDVILTGEPISGARAHELGLVSRLVEPGEAVEEAMRVAERVAAAGPLAVQASRRVVLAATHAAEADLWEMSNREFDAVVASEDTAEGFAAFLDRRPPVWRGR